MIERFLSDAEVSAVVRRLIDELGADFRDLMERSGIDMADVIRWNQLSKVIAQTREDRRIQLRDLAAQAGIPQYRIRTIEQGELPHIRWSDVEKVVESLGLNSLLTEWMDAYPRLASKMRQR